VKEVLSADLDTNFTNFREAKLKPCLETLVAAAHRKSTAVNPVRSPIGAKDNSPGSGRAADATPGKRPTKSFPRPSDGRGWREAPGEGCRKPDESRQRHPKSVIQISPGLTAGIVVLHAVEHHCPFHSGLIAARHVRVLIGDFERPTTGKIQKYALRGGCPNSAWQ